MKNFKKTLNFSIKGLFFVMVPATFGILVLGNNIVRILFQRGEFTAYSTMITHQALLFYAVGLFSYAGIKMLVFSFYSMQDTVTPVKTASCALLINLVLNLILMWPLKTGGLALATSIAGIFNFLALFYMLTRRIGRFCENGITAFLTKVLAASLVMGTALYFISRAFSASLPVKGLAYNSLYLAGSVITGIFIYFIMLLALRVKESGKLIRWILRIR